MQLAGIPGARSLPLAAVVLQDRQALFLPHLNHTRAVVHDEANVVAQRTNALEHPTLHLGVGTEDNSRSQQQCVDMSQVTDWNSDGKGTGMSGVGDIGGSFTSKK